MNLTITHYNNFFKVTGILNRQSVGMFQKEFQDVFERNQSITISIEGLQSIDKDGVNALAKLHNESIVLKKQLSIIGFGCKDLYDHFKSNDAA
jgi:ABC-type transporter Mla MlaB component